MPDHLGLSSTGARSAILTGDPTRVSWMAEAWGGEVVSEGDQRGFRYVETTDVVVVGTGIGAPATAIVTEELIELGVENLVRIGSCGAMSALVKPGDLVLSTGAIRDEGTSGAYLPPEVPALPDFDLLTALVAAARKEAAVACHVGLTHCKDAYYSEDPARTLDEDAARRRWATLARAGALATEMEAAALFAVAQVRGARAGAILVSVSTDVEKAYLRSALETAVRITWRAVSITP